MAGDTPFIRTSFLNLLLMEELGKAPPLDIEIIRLHSIEGWEFEKIREGLTRRNSQSESVPRLTISQLKGKLGKYKIFKNINEVEVFHINNEIHLPTAVWSCLVFGNGILLDIRQLQRHHERKNGCLKATLESKLRRGLSFIHLESLNLRALDEPEQFKNFRRLLFYAQVHFAKSFEEGIWAPDHRGIYERSPNMRAHLSNLSNAHNMTRGALDRYKKGEIDRARDLMTNAFSMHESIVRNQHHRQISDILAILLLAQDGWEGLQKSITLSLVRLARQHLPEDDYRKIMLESLKTLSLDPSGHLYLAFDSYCRAMWMSKIRSDDAKAWYSYNQASIPRATKIGAFFDFFKGRHLDDTLQVLQRVNMELAEDSHETLMIWHTAIRSLREEKKYSDMEVLASQLCNRLRGLGNNFDDSQARQFNQDFTLSFFLLGVALEAQSKLHGAREAFQTAVETRTQLVPVNIWDSGRANALERLKSILLRLGYTWIGSDYTSMEESMYSQLGQTVQRLLLQGNTR